MWCKIPLLLPLILVMVTSGCTLPGGLCIPGFPCAPTIEEANDVYVIDSLTALPKEVSPGQDLRLIAIVESKATRATESKDKSIDVELYDYCEGLFTINEGTCGSEAKCEIKSLIPGEKREIYWTLRSNDDTKLPSICKFKVRAEYQYTTNSVTQVFLIDYAEMQRQLNEGTFREESSPYSGSFGPLKPYLTIEDTQPIPVSTDSEIVKTVFGFQIKNKGKGFLTNCDAKDKETPGIKKTQIGITTQGAQGNNFLKTKLDGEIDKITSERLTLIGSETPKLILNVDDWDVGNIPIKTTKVITTIISDYCYEFRKEVDVKVQPKS